MFIGHFGVAFAVKKVAPKVSLGVLFLACQFMDLVWPVLVLLGIEKVSIEPQATAFNSLNFEYYPFTHSLFGALLLSMLVRWVYYAVTRDQKNSLIVGAVVLSHWFLDWIVHRPDLPLSVNNMNKMGLGLWNSVTGTVILESIIFFGGYIIYRRMKTPASPAQRWGLVGLLSLLSVVYALNVWGPQPEITTPGAAIAGPALAMWLFVPWAWWVDKDKKSP